MENPGSEQVRYTIERDGFIDTFEAVNARIFTKACGPCIGQWAREGAEKEDKILLHSFNRNFQRADGNPNKPLLVSEMVAALAISEIWLIQ